MKIINKTMSQSLPKGPTSKNLISLNPGVTSESGVCCKTVTLTVLLLTGLAGYTVKCCMPSNQSN